jgi:hypothetical protein
MVAPPDPPSLTPLFQEPEPPEPVRSAGPGRARPPAGDLAFSPPSGSSGPAADGHPGSPASGPSHPVASDTVSPGVSGTSQPAASGASAALVLVIVDGANVVGSVPDGWWRDRAGAAVRLRDSLAAVPAAGLPDVPAPVEVVLVVEGRARDIPQDPGGVRVERAPGSGDDKIVDLVRDTAATRRTIVVTADRGLRERVTALGAEVRGPSVVPR